MKQLTTRMLASLAVLLLPVTATAAPVTVDFDDLVSGTALTTQYSLLGVIFSGTEDGSSFAPEVRSQQFVSVPNSSPNYLTNFFVPGSTLGDDRLDTITIDFLGVANSVSLFLNTAGTNTVSFDLYDASDNFSSTVSLAGSASNNVFHNVGSGIGKMVATQPSDDWWWALDDLSFDLQSTSAVPAPATIVLLCFGLLGVRRRNRI